jgi:histidine triad (HIT) family protein
MRQANHTCTFCDIVHGAGEVSLCYEDSDALAFMDIQPVNAGHVLVVPRTHYEGLADVPRQLTMHLFDIAVRLADVVRQVTGCDDMNIVVNSGEAAGQDVLHYHVHVIPRRHGDGFDIPLPFGGSEMPDRTQLDAMAARLIAALRDPMRDSGTGGGGRRQAETLITRSSDRPDANTSSARPVERVTPIATVREVPVMRSTTVHRDDVSDAEPRRHWSVPYEGAHGELRSDP